MITNDRSMGLQAGYFRGKEVEATVFAGQDTLFFTSLTAAMTKKMPAVQHVFFCVPSRYFFSELGACDHWHVLEFVVTAYLNAGYNVTVELNHAEFIEWSGLTELRQKYDRFCVLIVLEVPLFELGGFAIKVAPSHVFTESPQETCVSVVGADQFLKAANCTSWEDYAEDVDGGNDFS